MKDDARPPALTGPAARALARHLIELAEREKEALARALHDELGSNLTAINLDLAAVAARMGAADAGTRARLERAVRVLKDTVTLKRRLIQTLRPGMLDSLGLLATVRSEIDDFAARTGLTCSVRLREDLPAPHPALALALYRVIELTLGHVERLVSVHHLSVALDVAGADLQLAIEVAGLELTPMDELDILTMRARLLPFAGRLSVRKGQPGLRIEASVPVAALPAAR